MPKVELLAAFKQIIAVEEMCRDKLNLMIRKSQVSRTEKRKTVENKRMNVKMVGK